MQSDISIQGVLFILSNPESDLRNICHVGVNIIAEINDFVNSLLELIDTTIEDRCSGGSDLIEQVG